MVCVSLDWCNPSPTAVTGRSKGYAFVEYQHTDEAEKAYHVWNTIPEAACVCVVVILAYCSLSAATRWLWMDRKLLLSLSVKELCLDGSLADWVCAHSPLDILIDRKSVV